MLVGVEEDEAETGLYYLRSRYYAPGMGRFVNGDDVVCVIGNLLSSNGFAYCCNNSIILSDDMGHLPSVSLHMTDGGAAAGTADYRQFLAYYPNSSGDLAKPIGDAIGKAGELVNKVGKVMAEITEVNTQVTITKSMLLRDATENVVSGAIGIGKELGKAYKSSKPMQVAHRAGMALWNLGKGIVTVVGSGFLAVAPEPVATKISAFQLCFASSVYFGKAYTNFVQLFKIILD